MRRQRCRCKRRAVLQQGLLVLLLLLLRASAMRGSAAGCLNRIAASVGIIIIMMVVILVFVPRVVVMLRVLHPWLRLIQNEDHATIRKEACCDATRQHGKWCACSGTVHCSAPPALHHRWRSEEGCGWAMHAVDGICVCSDDARGAARQRGVTAR